MEKDHNDRDERRFELGEAMAAALRAGESVDPKTWAKRFDLEPADVEGALRALEGLRPKPGAGLAPAPADSVTIAEPNLPGDLHVIEELGRGGMGVVWRAHQNALNRDVAVKVLMPTEVVFGSALERFRREAKSLARLRHPHIVRIHDVGECDGHLYFVMDLIEGMSLASTLKRDGAMNPARAVRLLRQVASAMVYVHERGIIHRDLKPANILVDGEGDAYVVDFGLALDRQAGTDLTLTGHLLGTPAYMAPEQVRGDRNQIGEASDVYSMGAILYECLDGKPPFAGLGLMELVQVIESKEPRSLTRPSSQVPLSLARVTAKAMAKDPGDRYASARALLEDLERFEAGQAVLAEPPSAIRGLRLWAKRHRITLAAVLVSVLVTVFALRIGARPSGEAVPAVLEAARRMTAGGEAASARLLLRDALDQGVELEGRELQVALAQKLVSGDDDAHARIVNCLEEREGSGRVDSSWRVLQLASIRLDSATETSGAILGKEPFRDRESGWDAVLDALAPAWTIPPREAWSAIALQVLDHPALGEPLVQWLNRQGASSDGLVTSWIHVAEEDAPLLKSALTRHGRAEAWADWISSRGPALLPHWIELLEDPGATAPTRAAALHLACTFTALPCSPWGDRLGVPGVDRAAEIAPVLSSWGRVSPAEWDLTVLQWVASPGDTSARTRTAWSGWLKARYKSTELLHPVPESAESLSEKVYAALGGTGSFASASASDLWVRFQGAKAPERGPWHRLLAHKLDSRTPIWPTSANGHLTLEPTSLASAWYRLVADTSGNLAQPGFAVSWAWLDVTDTGAKPNLIDEGSAVVMPGVPFEVHTFRTVEGSAALPETSVWGVPETVPAPAYLWQPSVTPDHRREIQLVGSVDLQHGGTTLRFERPPEAYREGLSFVTGHWRGLQPDQAGLVLEFQHDGSERASNDEPVREALIAQLHSSSEPEEVDWTGTPILRTVRTTLESMDAKRRARAASRPSPKPPSPQRRWIFGILIGFVAISILFGLIDGFRRARRAGIPIRTIGQTTSHVVLGLTLSGSMMLGPGLEVPVGWVGPCLCIAGLCAWFSIPRPSGRLSLDSMALRVPAILWLTGAAFLVGTTWLQGQVAPPPTPLAWATLLWPLGALTGGLILEYSAWRMGLFHPFGTPIFLFVLFAAFGDGLVSGAVLVLDSFDAAHAQALAAQIARARETSSLVKFQFALQLGPLDVALFHATWWTLFLRFGRLQSDDWSRLYRSSH